MIDEKIIREDLAALLNPITGEGLARIVGDIHLQTNSVEINFNFPYPAKTIYADLEKEVQTLMAKRGIENVVLNQSIDIQAHICQGGVEHHPSVKNIIAVSSAKGGVGKSTIAANLALALSLEGARVGLLDADIYGPSLPVMLGVTEKPKVSEEGGIKPICVHDLQVMSIGFMIAKNEAMIWRGPIATRALTQLFQETRWQAVDYLILDLPPGTGDIQLTIAQKIPVTGAVIVTTPQELAVADARRGLAMFNKVSIPVLGVLENMSVYHCPCCGERAHLFGHGGVQRMCEQEKINCLASLPLDANIGLATDTGVPIVLSNPDCEVSHLYRQVALKIAVLVSLKSKYRSKPTLKIVPEK